MMGADGEEDVASLRAGTMEIALCLAQALHEIDPQAAARINFAAAKAYNRLQARGEHRAAEMVYEFGRLLLDPALFPRDDQAARD